MLNPTVIGTRKSHFDNDDESLFLSDLPIREDETEISQSSKLAEIFKMSNPIVIGTRSSHSDDDESLSLSDLPIREDETEISQSPKPGGVFKILNPSVIGTRKSHSDDDGSLSLSDLPNREDETEISQSTKPAEDFDFGSLSASLAELESEMCVADEVFFRGKILPFRHSVSSTPTTTATSIPIPRSVSRSESMDRIPGLQSSSTSRSSSTRSSSINSSASADKISHRKNRALMNGQSGVGPRPYGGAPIGPRRSTGSSNSPLWEFFRVGLVKTPEIELEDLKFRYSRNQGSVESEEGKKKKKKEKEKKKKMGMGLMRSCKCTVEAVEPEKVAGKRKQEVTRHHRTFEWLRELSNGVVLNDV